MKKKVLLLVNTGTPASPSVSDVRRYLSEFLNDKRVIDLPWLVRKLLVNLIIVPFRAPGSAGLYKMLWTDKGSPLAVNLENLVIKIRSKVKYEYQVIGSMRYGEPSLRKALEDLKKQSPEQIIIFPLYPHYASSTTGSVKEFVMNEVRTWNIIPEIKFAGQFYSHPLFLDVISEQIKQYDPSKYDHVLFSYHGLPLSQIQKIHPGTDSDCCSCVAQFPDYGDFCYKAVCYQTTRLIIRKLNLDKGKCSTSFQSRISKDWIEPFTDIKLKDLAHSGHKRVLVVAPSFVADCLETIIELRHENRNLFSKEGGEELTLVESLNDSDKWADAIIKIAEVK